uniref:hypothetical protein n=1 Tax=Amycolatopsis sp. CA-290885 TaxID=3239925 RepID=UPI003F499BAE
MSDQVAAARQRVVDQAEDALYAAMSDEEIAERKQLSAQLRREQFAEHVRNERAQLAAERAAGDRERRIRQEDAATDDLLRREQASAARWRRRAAAEADKLTSNDALIAQVARLLVITKRVLVGLATIGMAWTAVNVQKNLVPDNNMATPMFWLSYGVEALFSGVLVMLMLSSAAAARAGLDQAKAEGGPSGSVSKGRGFDLAKWSRYGQEALLLSVSLGLCAGPELHAGNELKALEYAVAPIGVAVVVWAYNHITGRLSAALVKLSVPQPSVKLDEEGVALLGHAQRAFAGMQAGELHASAAADGGGVPAATQLARYLEVSKPIAMRVRDVMKSMSRGQVVISVADQEEATAAAVVTPLR